MTADDARTSPDPADDPRLEQLAARIAGGLVALDFDGTLAPIVRDPETSRPVEGTLDALQALVAVGVRLAFITGREAETVVRLGGFEDLPGLLVDGVYGAQQLRDGRLTVLPTPPEMTAARAEVDGVLTGAGADPAVWVEDKDVSFVVHTRLAADPDAAFDVVAGPVTALAERHHLEVHPGKQVLEVRVPGVDKGGALGALLDELDPTAVLWAGDDLGDIPAFERVQVWREQTGRPAVGVGVRPSGSPDPLAGADTDIDPRVAAVADVVVDGPAAVVALLQRLAATG
ncbi:trehalose-phosphatase [Jatrophihabitans sp. YIM 134969]